MNYTTAGIVSYNESVFLPINPHSAPEKNIDKQSYSPFFRKPAFIHVIAKCCRDIFKFLSPMQINTPPQGKLIYTFVTNVMIQPNAARLNFRQLFKADQLINYECIHVFWDKKYPLILKVKHSLVHFFFTSNICLFLKEVFYDLFCGKSLPE